MLSQTLTTGMSNNFAKMTAGDSTMNRIDFGGKISHAREMGAARREGEDFLMSGEGGAGGRITRVSMQSRGGKRLRPAGKSLVIQTQANSSQLSQQRNKSNARNVDPRTSSIVVQEETEYIEPQVL